MAEDHGIVLAMQNHGPDVVNNYQDVLSLIRDVGSPALKACMDINIEPEAESAEHAREMARASGKLQVHSHFNAEFRRNAECGVELAAGGYFDDRFWSRRVAYPAYVEALIASGYEGYIDWEFCHPAMENGKPAGIDYIHNRPSLPSSNAGAEKPEPETMRQDYSPGWVDARKARWCVARTSTKTLNKRSH